MIDYSPLPDFHRRILDKYFLPGHVTTKFQLFNLVEVTLNGLCPIFHRTVFLSCENLPVLVRYSRGNLVPRVLWLFGQRVGASRDSGVLEFCYRKISAVKQWKSLKGSQSKNLNFFKFPRISTGAHPLTKKPEDSGYEIALPLLPKTVCKTLLTSHSSWTLDTNHVRRSHHSMTSIVRLYSNHTLLSTNQNTSFTLFIRELKHRRF